MVIILPSRIEKTVKKCENYNRVIAGEKSRKSMPKQSTHPLDPRGLSTKIPTLNRKSNYERFNCNNFNIR